MSSYAQALYELRDLAVEAIRIAEECSGTVAIGRRESVGSQILNRIAIQSYSVVQVVPSVDNEPNIICFTDVASLASVVRTLVESAVVFHYALCDVLADSVEDELFVDVEFCTESG